jgi:two-component system, chemotaxis family, sensor kinase CheA
MNLELGRPTLVQEARDLLHSMEDALLQIEQHGYDDEHINAIFRAAHTIKGSAGLFGLTLIERFTQRLENVLDALRSGTRAPESALLALVLECTDYIAQLVDAIEACEENEDPAPELRERLLRELASFSDEPASTALPAAGVRADSVVHLSVRFAPSFLNDGLCPSAYVEHLAQLGELLYVQLVSGSLPARAEFVADRLYVGVELGMRSARSVEELTSAFQLAGDSARLQVLEHTSKHREFDELLDALGSERGVLAAHWAQCGLYEAHAEPEPARAENVAPPAKQVAEARPPERGAASGDKPRADQKLVKVHADRLDQLIDLVGELVIASEGARTVAGRTAHAREEMSEAIERVSQLVAQVRDSSLTLRMTPIGEVFQRFPRVVRDVSRELGKQIELKISGAEAELDKSMVDRLADPLMHIVRNAMDHGIEPVAERTERGKPQTGQLHLHAHHESGCIVVEVRDDGRGLDAERLRRKAIERGLIEPEARLSEAQCFQLIFAPGFSTAEVVTSLSGRGVGMDVVRRNVESLRGEVEIESTLGVGSTFRLRLPLTLAIIEGFHVEVADSTFVIPLDMVIECVDLRERGGPRQLLNLRQQPLPFMRLRDVFGLDAAPSPRESLVVVGFGQQRVGIVVDRLLGNSQAVIKPLGQLFRGLHGVSASTILGDGDVALILDVPALIADATQRAGAAAAATRQVEGP